MEKTTTVTVKLMRPAKLNASPVPKTLSAKDRLVREVAASKVLFPKTSSVSDLARTTKIALLDTPAVHITKGEWPPSVCHLSSTIHPNFLSGFGGATTSTKSGNPAATTETVEPKDKTTRVQSVRTASAP